MLCVLRTSEWCVIDKIQDISTYAQHSNPVVCLCYIFMAIAHHAIFPEPCTKNRDHTASMAWRVPEQTY